MAQATTKDLTTLPVGRLGLIPLISCKLVQPTIVLQVVIHI